jgi:hypothetical protein
MSIIEKGKRVLGRAIPDGLKRRVKRKVMAKRKAEVSNVYHCTTHKAASSWIAGLLGDRLLFSYSGLDRFTYQSQWMDGRDPRDYDERYFSKPLPKYTAATRLYWNYDCFRHLPKPDDYRTFFVLRDPRDVVVSWYFSMKNTHSMEGVEKRIRIRSRLQELPKRDGFCFAIKHLSDYGLFEAQRSWMDVDDPKVRIFKYEDLTGPDQFKEVKSLFDHCTIQIPDSKLRTLLRRHGWEATEERKKGDEDRSSHRRKGVAGDWRNHFDSVLKDRFLETVGHLPIDLGYPPTRER